MTSLQSTTSRIHRQKAAKRGVAMLLVLISLMTASILTIAYVASRDNSAIIGDNVASSAAARWTADAGLEMGLAILQTNADWRSSADGQIVSDYALDGGTLDIAAIDLQTGGAPGAATEYVELTSTANVNGLEQAVSAVVHVPAPANQGADVDLSEFAIFTAQDISLSGDAIVMRWPKAPLATIGQPLALGTQATGAGSVLLNNQAVIIDGIVYAPPGASGSIVLSGNGMRSEVFVLPDHVPMPEAPHPGVADPGPSNPLAGLLDLIGGLLHIVTDTRVPDATLSGGSQTVLQGPIEFISDDDVTMNNSMIKVSGNVKMVVFDKLELINSSIELMPGANLKLYVGS